MKILFISRGNLPDYQSDMVFHGGRSLFGEDFVDLNHIWYMYKDDKEKYWNERVPGNGKEYGRGFTMAGTLPLIDVDRTDIKSKIENHYFDKIIYGSIHRERAWVETVLDNYEPKDIIFVDGEDSSHAYVNSIFGRGLYFKREMDIVPHTSILPISFAIPREKIISEYPTKTRMLAHIIPGWPTTYIYETEEDYYKGYRESYFGMTFKKGGWDCLRHYEILANRCVPYFPGLESCPETTMMSFPKDIILKTNEMYESGEVDEGMYEAMEQILNMYTTTYLTTEALFNYVIDQCDS